MAKQRQTGREIETPAGPARGRDRLAPWALLAGFAALALLGWLNYREAAGARADLKARLDPIEQKVAQIGAKVDAMGAAAQRRPSGPDPNRVYAIKTDGAPAKGPAAAPVVIAEFSDFQ